MARKEMDKCPKCGGTSGVYFVEWQEWMCCFKWDGTPDEGDCIGSKGGRMLYCRDCNQPVMRASSFGFKD